MFRDGKKKKKKNAQRKKFLFWPRRICGAHDDTTMAAKTRRTWKKGHDDEAKQNGAKSVMSKDPHILRENPILRAPIYIWRGRVKKSLPLSCILGDDWAAALHYTRHDSQYYRRGD
jgi:hypothetical protein